MDDDPRSSAISVRERPSSGLFASLSTHMIETFCQPVASTRLCGQPPGVQHGQPGTSSSIERRMRARASGSRSRPSRPSTPPASAHGGKMARSVVFAAMYGITSKPVSTPRSRAASWSSMIASSLDQFGRPKASMWECWVEIPLTSPTRMTSLVAGRSVSLEPRMWLAYKPVERTQL